MKINGVKTVIRHLVPLLASSDSAQLDAELLVAHVLGKTRSDLYAFPEFPVPPAQQLQAEHLAARRARGEPMAYVLGMQEFWSLPLKVTPATLIPRPATESLVEWILERFPAKATDATDATDATKAAKATNATKATHATDAAPVDLKILDLGTGSGAIAIALAHERPQWEVHASDISMAALQVAADNAKSHVSIGRPLCFHLSDCFATLQGLRFDCIVSNPPYIAREDPAWQLASQQFEPHLALVAKEAGLQFLLKIIEEAPRYLNPQGVLVLEHGYQQQAAVRSALQNAHYSEIKGHCDLSGTPRFCTALCYS